MMAVVTVQAPLPLVPAGARYLGGAAAVVEDEEGGRVFHLGEVVYAWDAGDEAGRRLAVVQLIERGLARTRPVAEAFGVTAQTVWRWRQDFAKAGISSLVPEKKGPKRASKLTAEVVADILARRAGGASYRAIAAAVGISEGSARRAVAMNQPVSHVNDAAASGSGATQTEQESVTGAELAADEEELPVLAAPAPRSAERALARRGLLAHAQPVFTAARRVPLAGLLLALPGLAATGLLSCAKDVYGRLPDGFYGLDTVLLEAVFRVLAGQPRAEGATRIDPVALGRVLGMDRAPEVKTIRRKLAQLAGAGKGADLLAALAEHHLARTGADEDALVLYVDGHVRAYQGGKKIAKTHSSRLRFPAPATVETWVSDAAGDPVLVVMTTPGASLAGEIRRLLPDLRAAVGDNRRVLVGFDRGGWSPALFAHMHTQGFDVLTWRKHPAPDIDTDAFTHVAFRDEVGRAHTWDLADTMVDLPLADSTTFRMRQVTRRDERGRQAHVLTTRTDLGAGEVMYKMGSRWRQENYFRYGRLHLALDSHDSYGASADDPDRSVPNPAKRHAHLAVQAARARVERERARTDAALLAARTPTPGTEGVVITNAQHDALTANLHAAQDDLAAAQTHHAQIPARVRLGDLAPDQQILDVETKLITHAVKMAAFNTITALARDIRITTGYARAGQEAYTLARQVLTHTGDIDTRTPGILTIRLDPLPTGRATRAIAELCEHLTATATTYPGTDLVLRYEIKPRP